MGGISQHELGRRIVSSLSHFSFRFYHNPNLHFFSGGGGGGGVEGAVWRGGSVARVSESEFFLQRIQI